MTLLPLSLVRIGRKLQQLSDWIDEKFFPLPATPLDRTQREQRNIEASVQYIEKQIDKCRKLKDTYECFDGINDFKAIWGDSCQVLAAYSSLILNLHKKEMEIINRINN